MQRHDAQWDKTCWVYHTATALVDALREAVLQGGHWKKGTCKFNNWEAMSWTLDTHKEFRWSNPEDFQKKITSGGPPLGPDSALVCPTLQQASREIAPGCHFWSRPAVKWSKNSNWNHTCSACNNLEGRKKKTSLSIKQWAVRHQLRHLVGCLWQPTSTVMSISVFNLDLHCHGCQWSHESALGRELLKDATLGQDKVQTDFTVQLWLVGGFNPSEID